MAEQVWESPVIASGEKRLRRRSKPRSLFLSRSMKVSLALFVLLVAALAAHSIIVIQTMQRSQQSLNVAARMDHHLERMVERAGHYVAIAPRNYPDFHRDVELYYTTLRRDIETMDALVADLAARRSAFDPDLWNDFRNGLEEQIGYEADRPRLEWAAEYLSNEAGPLLAAADRAHAELQSAAAESRRNLWISGGVITAATLLLACTIAWLFRERVLRRISQTSRAVRRMSDGQFDGIRRKHADDELGQLEADVGNLARRTEELVNLLDTLNGANTLHEAIERLPMRLKRQFSIEWMGLVEIFDGRMRLRISVPAREELGIEQPGTGWSLEGTLLADARRSGHAMFATLRNSDGDLGLHDPLLRQLRGCNLVTAALLPVRDSSRIQAGVMIASAHADAFTGWRGRWLENVGHLIAHALYKSIHVEQLGVSMVRGLAEMAEKRDPNTGRHLDRMQRYAGIVARELVERGAVDTARCPRFAEQVETFAPLHDIGKVGISDYILLKPGPLTNSEVGEMRRHPKIGAEVLMTAGERLGAEGEKLLAHAMDIALYHHEKFDGSGYPHGLVGEAIPLSARIVAVVDVYDSLTSERPYKEAWSDTHALQYLESEKGRHFDPQVVDAFVARIDDIRRIHDLFRDRDDPVFASRG
ncbi:MAG: HD domain-containing phosphohydrolase [Wenzhouxiangellaceae bacterium]|nr:HD domain-containing phosphohydrolase [Wenzhouxiangellaceae bacterium]